MRSHADEIVTCPPKETRGGYQSIESGYTGAPMEEEKTFFGQVREAKEQSQGCCDFCLIFFSLLISSIVWVICVAIVMVLPLFMIVIGAVNFHDCSIERMIPIFNIVAGSVLTVNNVLHLICRFHRFSGTVQSKVITWISAVLHVFLFVWFFVGCYYVYHIEPPTKDKCNLKLYTFTFWLVSAVFLIFGTVVVASCLALCLAMICW